MKKAYTLPCSLFGVWILTGGLLVSYSESYESGPGQSGANRENASGDVLYQYQQEPSKDVENQQEVGIATFKLEAVLKPVDVLKKDLENLKTSRIAADDEKSQALIKDKIDYLENVIAAKTKPESFIGTGTTADTRAIGNIHTKAAPSLLTPEEYVTKGGWHRAPTSDELRIMGKSQQLVQCPICGWIGKENQFDPHFSDTHYNLVEKNQKIVNNAQQSQAEILASPFGEYPVGFANTPLGYTRSPYTGITLPTGVKDYTGTGIAWAGYSKWIKDLDTCAGMARPLGCNLGDSASLGEKYLAWKKAGKPGAAYIMDMKKLGMLDSEGSPKSDSDSRAKGSLTKSQQKGSKSSLKDDKTSSFSSYPCNMVTDLKNQVSELKKKLKSCQANKHSSGNQCSQAQQDLSDAKQQLQEVLDSCKKSGGQGAAEDAKTKPRLKPVHLSD